MLLGRKKQPDKLDLTEVEIVPLSSTISYNKFDCGARALTRWLKNKAWDTTKRKEFSVHCAVLEGKADCIGYYALQLGSDRFPNEVEKKKRQDFSQNYEAFPTLHLSYLAVDEAYQGQGLGEHLLMNVFEKAYEISQAAGFYALTLTSYDERSTSFYKKLEFETYAEGAQPKLMYPLRRIIKLLDPAD